MTDHDHSTFVEGCYRCELGRDEARDSRGPFYASWGGYDSDKNAWRLEVEPDRMKVGQPMAVTIDIEDHEGCALAELTPADARDVAAVLMAAADHAERDNVARDLEGK